MENIIGIIRKELEKGKIIDFSVQGKPYLIQLEQNKGWDYISIWQMGEYPSCIARSLFDIFDGVSGETVEDLLRQPCIEGKSFLQWAEEDDRSLTCSLLDVI